MTKEIDKKELSDLDIDSLGPGFSIIFEDGKPVAAIAKFEYYKYIKHMIEQVKNYIVKGKGDNG